MGGGCQLHKNIKNIFNVGVGRDLPLRLGQVDFINCLPINLPIELGEIKIDSKIISDVPSELNRLILSGDIDIAPVSSFTYIENKDKLTPISDLCIASNSPSDSVLLFSYFPIEELDRAKIALTYASATSNKLLEIIFREFLKINVTLDVKNLTLSELSKEYPASLFIGDHALLEFSKKPRNLFIYDLGALWKKYTSLPMVFAVWVIRKEVLKNYQNEVKLITSQLEDAKKIGLSSLFESVIKKAQEKVFLSKEFYVSYFEHLSYDLKPEYKKGLELFEELCKKQDGKLRHYKSPLLPGAKK